MTDLISKILDQFGPLGLFVLTVAFVAWLIYTGRLVPRRFYEDVVKQRDTAIVAAQVSNAQVDKLLGKDDTIIALLTSINTQAEKAQGRRSGSG